MIDAKIIRMQAGLANRMFQYSCYLYLKQKGYETYVDNSYKAKMWKMEDISWARIFPNAPIKQASHFRIGLNGGGYGLWSRFIRRFCWGVFSKTLGLKNFEIPSAENLKRYNLFVGVFQNSIMVESVKDVVLDSFQFSPFEDVKNLAFLKKISKENSVAIHVRKGEDYLKKDIIKGTCPIEYYISAINYIKAKINNPQFYVFTDNKRWVEDNFDGIDYTLVDWNPSIGWGNHYDMELMSFCSHNIIANSTYSWWGAFLNRNPHKIVIMPNKWFNKIDLNNEVILNTKCKNWVVL